MSKLKIERQCSDCKGTGLYQGMGERKPFAVVCHNCNGTGKEVIEIDNTPFTGRKTLKEVSQVLQYNPGFCVGGEQLNRFGGMSYKEWIQGKPFPAKSEMRGYVCPAWWYQTADYKKKPDWDECIVCGSFSGCKHFPDKDKCWERFDKESK